MSNESPIIVVGGNSSELGERLASKLDAQVSQVKWKTHPDGERYARIMDDVGGREVVVLQTCFPPQNLIDLLHLLSAAQENGAKDVVCVAPYLPMRQDRIFNPGESVWAKVVMSLIATQADKLITVELHKPDIARHFRGRCINLETDELFARKLKSWGIQAVIAPDIGASARAKKVAGLMGVQSDYLEKTRVSGTEVKIRPKSLDVSGLRTAILDDMISTGGTMEAAIPQLKAEGASSVMCAATHGLFIGDAYQRLVRAGASSIIISDTIDCPDVEVTVADLVANAVRDEF